MEEDEYIAAVTRFVLGKQRERPVPPPGRIDLLEREKPLEEDHWENAHLLLAFALGVIVGRLVRV